MLKIIDPKDSVHESPSYNLKKPLKRNKVKIKYKIFLIGVYYLSKKDINQPRFCGETDITLDYGSRIQGSNPCRTAILKF